MAIFKDELNCILGGFNKIIARLDALHIRHTETIAMNNKIVEDTQANTEFLEQERKKALEVREKIAQLVG